MKTSAVSKILLIVAALLLLWAERAPLAAGWAWFSNRDAVVASMRQFGAWAPAVLCVLLVLQVFLAFIPGQALMIASGYLYGFWGGLLITWMSLMLGGQVAFLLARRYGRPFAERWISPATLERWDAAARGQGIGFFAMSLVLPIFPNDAMCYVAGLGNISSRRFLVAGALGRGTACVLASAAGAYGAQIPLWGWAVGIGSILAASLVWTIVKHRRSRAPLAPGEESRTSA
ncbi:MAG TPA: VTT domain-containing protein [Anaerolineales bacterium]|jgi:uncharacterized membrane protein YdjX (TVP38/TMEM64 family)